MKDNPISPEKWPQHISDIRYLQQGDFIYYRAGRVDRRDTIHTLSELDKAIAYCDTHRPKLIDSTPEQIAEYNVWTNIKNYLWFMKYKLPVDDTN